MFRKLKKFISNNKQNLIIAFVLVMAISNIFISNYSIVNKPLTDLENDLKLAMESGKYIILSDNYIAIKDSFFSISRNFYIGTSNILFKDATLKERLINYVNMQNMRFTIEFLLFMFSVLLILVSMFVLSIRSLAKKKFSSFNDDFYTITTNDDNKLSKETIEESYKKTFMKAEIAKKYPSIEDVKGISEITEEVSQIVDFLKNKDKYLSMGARLPKGIILYGPPGTGKTMLAKAMANDANIGFIYASGSSFINKYVGTGADNIRKIFAKARDNAPCILFIDEIDAIGGKRDDDTHSEYLSTLEALLVELDGFNSRDGIFVIAATNRIDSLDDALTRPGRFDKSIAVPLPDYKGRLEILQGYCKGKNLSEDVNLELIAKQTQGLSGAYLETIVNEAIILAVKNNRDYITQKDFMESIYTILLKGKMRKREDQDELERKTIAYHEAGHALVSKLIIGEEVSKVTIIGSTSGAGGVTFSVPKNISLYSKKDLINQVMKLYAGRAAEEILRGKDNITIGASNDIDKATDLIYQMVSIYGLNDNIGLLNLHKFRHSLTDDSLEEMKKLSNEIYKQTLSFLEENLDLLELMADELLEKETLLDTDLENILSRRVAI